MFSSKKRQQSDDVETAQSKTYVVEIRSFVKPKDNFNCPSYIHGKIKAEVQSEPSKNNLTFEWKEIEIYLPGQ